MVRPFLCHHRTQFSEGPEMARPGTENVAKRKAENLFLAENDQRPLEWMETEFQEAVHSHRTTLRQIVKRPIGLSLANAIYKVLQYWYFDSPPGEILSLGVISKGEFNIPANLIFSMPVRFCSGKWVIQNDIKINKETQRKLQHIVQELKMEESFDFSPITEMDMGNSLSYVAEHLPESIGEIVQEEDKAKEE